MAATNSTGLVTRTPDAPVPLYARVKRTATGVATAGAADPTYGTALRRGFGPDPDTEVVLDISVKQVNAPGTHFAKAVDAIPEGGEFEGADDGGIKALAGGTPLGIVEEAAVEGATVEVTYYASAAEGGGAPADPDA